VCLPPPPVFDLTKEAAPSLDQLISKGKQRRLRAHAGCIDSVTFQFETAAATFLQKPAVLPHTIRYTENRKINKMPAS
jgi:hypothetical protein